ncbi:MAG TPA: cell division protein SepF [Candidatus Anaerofilum excrementigallinarum]|nr:cell division protein SepF [Candidatus Anaerofilum excrementigallinarum]
MSVFANIKHFLSGEDDEDYEEYGYEEEESSAPRSRGGEEERAGGEEGGKRNKIVNINATTQLQVVLVKPERFDDVFPVADHLNQRRTVVLNLESNNKELSRRIVDFLSGVAYANDGQIKRVANSTFIITPCHVNLMGGDILDELESNGVFF